MRRQVREGRLAPSPPARFVPLRVAETAPITTGLSSRVNDRAVADTIEIMSPDGLHPRVGNDINLVGGVGFFTSSRFKAILSFLRPNAMQPYRSDKVRTHVIAANDSVS
jgi:hypothetical protein